MAHEIETTAYANEVPWHGIGNRVDPSVSIEEMTKAAGLDWTVELRPLFAEARDGAKLKIPLKRALVRSSDNKVLTITGDYWKPVQPREGMEFFREYTESGGATLETAGSLYGGKLIWALARIKKDFYVKGAGTKRDQVNGYILLSIPQEVGKATKVRTTATRVVCANTFAMAERDACQYSQSHTKKFDIQAAKDSIQIAQDQIAKLEADANQIAALQMSDFDATRLLSRQFQPVPEGEKEDNWVTKLLNEANSRSKLFDGVWDSYMTAPGAQPGTGWGVFNGVTHYMDHVAGKEKEARLANAWFGARAAVKRDVLTDLLEMV